jgi:predicted dehydrogenase
MTLRIGLLAASRIAGEAVIEPAPLVPGVEVVVVAARSGDRAAEAAERWRIPRHLAGYEGLYEDPDVDAIYIGSPAAFHPEQAIAAVAAGKHVLVEKPIAANAADARHLAEAVGAGDRVVMEAAHWRYHPLVGLMAEALDRIGPIEHAVGRFEVGARHIPTTDIRYDLALGGGAMMDLGVYPAMWLTWLMGGPPTVVAAEARVPVAGIDAAMAVDVVWPGGATGRMEVSMDRDDIDRVWVLEVTGDRGHLSVDNPLAPQHGSRLVVETAEGRYEPPVPTTTTYQHQLAAFRDAVALGTPFPTTVDAAVVTMELVDAAYRAAGLDPRPGRLTPS